jgi:hypothetical protein
MEHIHLLWDVPLFWWHAWGAVASPLIEDLGVLGVVFAFCVFVARYLEHRWKKKSHAEALAASKEFFHDNFLTPLLDYMGVFLMLGFALGPYEVHEQDRIKIGDRDSLSEQVRQLQSQLQTAKNNLDVHSAAANNLMYLMQAFRGYRGMIGGFKPLSCQLRVTAPSDSGSIPSTVAAFSIQATNCPTFGPMDTNGSPDEERDTVTGMIPEVIVFHSRRDDRAAFNLYDNLSNLLPLKRSYEIPKGSPENFIWLQFGPGVQWNSQKNRSVIVH